MRRRIFFLCFGILLSISLGVFYVSLKKEEKVSLGLMSGTSMDGIDGALIRTDGYFSIEELGHVSVTYKPEFHQLLKAAEYLVRACQGDMQKAHKAHFLTYFREYLKEVIHLNPEDIQTKVEKAVTYLTTALGSSGEGDITLADVIKHSTQLHSQVVFELLNQRGYEPHQVDVIGYHGQTLFHKPSQKITIQVGDGQLLADMTGIQVVNDFRSRDVSMGGQGAPFAPLYHQALAVRDQLYPLAVVNCGGIANISMIRGKKFEDLIGYDTGPGNGLVDLWVKQKTRFVEQMDVDGRYGKRGKVLEDILKKLYECSLIVDGRNYFEKVPPKSLDINDLKLIPDLDGVILEDGCATLEAFTADSIVKSLNFFPGLQPKQWVLVGGGWYNPVIREELMKRIKSKFGEECQVHLAEEIGWNNKAMEAQIFAYLAVRSLKKLPISVPETTKVPEPLTGGRLHIPQAEKVPS